MTEKTYTGSELKAWRERLGLSAREANALPGMYYSVDTLENCSGCLPGLGRECEYCPVEKPVYAAALAAEEARRAPAEPVPPEGVTTRVIDGGGGGTYVSINRGCDDDLIAVFWHDAALSINIQDECATPEALEYVAALSRYRAAQHAAKAEREREKLAAVKAAEEAHAAAMRNEEACVMAREHAKRLADESFRALQAARKEAGIS